MSVASQYPVTFPFGATSAPYSASSPHKGEDRAMPNGTAVVVNGVIIGLSNNTGNSTGPHLHIGRFVNGQATPPNGGGFQFNSAVVTEINQDATNGKYVRVQGDGASWVYLHLSDNGKVKVGQELKGGDMSQVGQRELDVLFQFRLGRSPDQGAIDNYIGKNFTDVDNAIINSPEYANLHVEATAAKLNPVVHMPMDLQNDYVAPADPSYIPINGTVYQKKD